MNRFAHKCIDIILKNEGGFQDDPRDYGNYTGPNRTGELIGTNFGIAARYFHKIVKERYGISIKDLTIPQAKELFLDYFWTPMDLEGILNHDLILHIFDHGVNANKRLAIRMIQKIVFVKADGFMGPITEKAINNFRPYTKVIQGYGLLSSILDHYKYARHCHYAEQVRKYPMKGVFYKGWLIRIEKTHFD